ncbi:hypothetical protein F5B20DRAFT_589103 [Whalleya microplaca]|nr:hypothetical protein F5B20DRAFT_589103 [Whalleya microplaca]
MRLCKALRQSSVTRRIVCPGILVRDPNRRYFADQSPFDKLEPASYDADSIQSDSSKRPLASDRDDAFNIDPESKTVDTARGKLPLSPIMDPSYWAAKQRHRQMKPKPGRPQNPLERQMRVNPFANALASSVRQCAVTRVRLPKFFLQDFRLVAHPETGDPWWVPRSLAKDEELEFARIGPMHLDHPTYKRPRESTQEAIDGSDESEEWPTPRSMPGAPPGNGQPNAPSAYTLSRQDLIASFVTNTSGFKNSQKRLMGPSSSRYRSLASKAIWREDMDTFILEQMRRHIATQLLYISRCCEREKRYYIVKCWGWNDVQYKHKGALLWFGEAEETPDSEKPQSQPGPFAIFDCLNHRGLLGTTSVPVHNLPMLLGSEYVKRLRRDASMLQDGEIFMLAGRRTVHLQMKLWRLQGYLTNYKYMTWPA